MKNLTQMVILFLISLSTSAQLPTTFFTNNSTLQNAKPATSLRTASNTKQQVDSLINSSTKTTYVYDAYGNTILKTIFVWNTTSKSWGMNLRYEYGYDATGGPILDIQYVWDNLKNVFVKNYKYERAFDANKNILSAITYDWDIDNSIWLPKTKFKSVPGSNGLKSKTYYYYWDGSTWNDNYFTEFKYNTNNLLLEENTYSSLDIIQSKTTYMYDVHDNAVSQITVNYNTNGVVDSENKFESTYDAKNLILSTQSEWNSGINDWEYISKREFEYDAQNNNTVCIFSNWNNQTNTWIYFKEIISTFDNTYSRTDLVGPVEILGLSKYKVIDYVWYDFADGDWEQKDKYTVYYTDITTTGIAHANSTALTVYPNPATDNVIFTNKTNDAATLELFNLQGNLIYKNTITMNQPVSVEGIADGMYLYRISNTNAGSYNGTLIIN